MIDSPVFSLPSYANWTWCDHACEAADRLIGSLKLKSRRRKHAIRRLLVRLHRDSNRQRGKHDRWRQLVLIRELKELMNQKRGERP